MLHDSRLGGDKGINQGAFTCNMKSSKSPKFDDSDLNFRMFDFRSPEVLITLNSNCVSMLKSKQQSQIQPSKKAMGEEPEELVMLICQECKAELDLNLIGNYYNHECFTKYDKNNYYLVSNEENEVFAVLKNLFASEISKSSITIDESTKKDKTCSNLREIINKDTDDLDSLVDHNQDETDEFIILEVKERKALWSCITNPKDRTKAKIKKMWESIANNILTMTTDEVIARWQFLKSEYIKARKMDLAYKAGGSEATTKEISFKFYDMMKFLNECLDPPKTVNSPLPKLSKEKENSIHDAESQKSSLQSIEERFKPNKRQKKNEDYNFEKEVLSIIKNDNTKPIDTCDVFGTQVAAEIRKLPEDNRIPLQCKILTLIHQEQNENKFQ